MSPNVITTRVRLHGLPSTTPAKDTPYITGGAMCGGWLVASFILISRPAPAQEALRNYLSGGTPMAVGSPQPESLPYTFKTGDFRLLATPSLGLDWNDNINLSKDHAEDDFIVRPLLGLNASYPITSRNLLQLNASFGYQKYLQHDQFSSWYIQSGSGLSFDVWVKDFRFNFHDQFSYVQDSAQEATIAGTGTYGNWQNLAGLWGTWDLQDVTLTLGYDHQIIQSTTDQFQEQDQASELFVGRGGFKVHPSFTTGVEGSVSFTRYDQMVLNDNTSYSAGVYGDWQTGRYFHLQARGGYTLFQFQHTSQTIQTGDFGSWYIGLTVTHQITDRISYSISAGHDLRLGIQADLVDEWYFAPVINWNIINNWAFQTGLSYQHGTQGVSNQGGNFTETYDWLTANFGLNHPITGKLTAGLNYRLTLRSSDQASQEYTQNLVGLQLSYLFQ